MTGAVETNRHYEQRVAGIIPWVGAPQDGPPGGIERRRDLIQDELAADFRVSEAFEEDSTGLLEEYFEARNQAVLEIKPSDEDLADIQHEVGSWLLENNIIRTTAASKDEYSRDDPLGARSKIVKLINHLALRHDNVSELELEASRLFLRSAYAMYESTPRDDSIHLDEDGDFAFLVPARMSRKNVEYGAEVASVIPVFHYVPNEMRAAMMLGLPPFVIDTYPRDATTGRRGYLIFVPVYPDSKEDLASEGIGASIRIARERVNSAVQLAHNRLGADLIGLGAMLPSMTQYGRSVQQPGVITTTGHGGTVQLMLETMKRAVKEGRVSPSKLQRIGVLGLGAIGGSMARIVKEEYPKSELFVYDTKKELMSRAVNEIGAIACLNECALLESSGITIAALPDVKMDLASLGVNSERMKGKLIIDDSQPAVFSSEQVEKYGATLAWVVGESRRGVRRSQYTYGNTLVGQAALFGCEAEVAILAAERRALQSRDKSKEEIAEILKRYSINTAVTHRDVSALGRLFRKHRITAAPLQAEGALI